MTRKEPAGGGAYFDGELFRFLRQLTRNNNREWFAANKARYEQVARDPLLRLIADLVAPMAKIDLQIDVDPRPVGGSMFRIYRDVRFARDKSPYKTNLAARFSPRTRRDGVAGAGYYVSISADGGYAAAGAWHPEAQALAAIRAHIVDHARAWRRLEAKLAIEGDRLKRPPRGYPADHPLIEAIKRKDFVTSAKLSRDELIAPQLKSTLTGHYRRMAPLVRFLNDALG